MSKAKRICRLPSRSAKLSLGLSCGPIAGPTLDKQEIVAVMASVILRPKAVAVRLEISAHTI